MNCHQLERPRYSAQETHGADYGGFEAEREAHWEEIRFTDDVFGT